MANRTQMLPLKLKTYLNKCRCCLQPFESGESITQITEFFEVQFYAFTHIELKSDQLLSKFVCEFCHMELVRFSVWKKELIAKQQQLYTALKQKNSNEKNPVEGSDFEEEDFGSETDGEIADGEAKRGIYDYDEHSSDDDNDVSTELDDSDDIINCESDEEDDESESGSTLVSTNDHESDADFKISARQQSRIYSSLTPMSSVKNPNLVCKNCKVQFLAQKGLTMHEKSCGRVKNGYKYQRPRKKERNDLNAKFVCTCGERFYSSRALNIHRSHKHRLEGPIPKTHFKIPPKVNSESSNSLTLKQRAEMIVNRKYSCIQCTFQTNNKRILIHHMKNHENSFDHFTSTKCPHCEKTLSSKSSLRMHINTVHSNFRPHKCQYCESSFKQLVHLKDHSLSVHQKLLKPYSCECGYMFVTQRALKRHKISFHREKKCVRSQKKEGHYVCSCNREYDYKSKLEEHQATCKIFMQHQQEENGIDDEMDENDKNHECPKCKRVFLRRQNLIRHQKSRGHLDKEQLKSMNVVCEKCQQRFFTKIALEKHLVRGSCLRHI